MFYILTGYLLFCGLSWLSRSFYPLFALVVLVGMGLPLIWAWRTGRWMAMGFTRRKPSVALLWGLIAGGVSGLVGLTVLQHHTIPSGLVQQLLIGVPMWVLVISPFQEFLFRGWLQSELNSLLGKWWGLLLATAGFTLWHYLSPIVDMASFPLASTAGLLSTFLAGLLYGYAFQRSDSIIAPWLAHALAGIIFVAVGAMDFVQAMS